MFDTFHLYTHSNNPKVKEFNKVVYEWADAKLIELFVKESKHGSIPDSLLPLGVLEISCQSDRIVYSKGKTDERGVQF